MLALKRAVAAARVGDTALISLPIRESKSNGAVEAAHQDMARPVENSEVLLREGVGSQIAD